MNCVFFGTPDFAVPALKALIKSDNYKVSAVFTQPDKKVGRKQTLTPPPVKKVALEYGITVFQPEKIKEEKWLDILRELEPDIIATAAFGQILSKELLDIPKVGVINVHGSLLPKYRGPAPIQWAIINGERVTGISTMFTDPGIDTGDILLKRETEIKEDETAGELFERLADMGAKVLMETLESLESISPVKQDESEASYFPMLKKEMAKIDFTKSAFEINNLIRGLNPWPVAYFNIDDLKINVFKAKVLQDVKGMPGEIISWNTKDGIIIGCGKGALEILSLQASGKKLMDAKSFVNGKKIEVGHVL